MYKKKFIFGNPKSKFGTFLRKFINGKNQFYLDDGFETIHYDFNKLKKIQQFLHYTILDCLLKSLI